MQTLGEIARRVQVAKVIEVGEMMFEGGLGDVLGPVVGVGDDDVAQHADRGAAGELGLRKGRAATFSSASWNASILVLARSVAPLVVKCRPRSPAKSHR